MTGYNTTHNQNQDKLQHHKSTACPMLPALEALVSHFHPADLACNFTVLYVTIVSVTSVTIAAMNKNKKINLSQPRFSDKKVEASPKSL
jgi:hypothetical protein